MSYDHWKTTDPRERDLYEWEQEEEELEWDDMEPLDVDDDEFFCGWLDAKTVSPEPCL
jgi:hypothetical protein